MVQGSTFIFVSELVRQKNVYSGVMHCEKNVLQAFHRVVYQVTTKDCSSAVYHRHLLLH